MNIVTNNISLQTLYQVLPSTNSVIHTIKKLALPVLGMVALSFLPAADAGQSAYLACLATCWMISMNPPLYWTYEGCKRSCEYSKMIPYV